MGFYVSKYIWLTGNPQKFLCHFWGLDFWWQKDRSVTKRARIQQRFDAFEGPQIGLEKWHQALGFRSGDLAVLGACFVCALLVVERCCDYWVLCFALLSFFCFVNAWFFLWTVWPDSFPQIVGSLCYQPKLHEEILQIYHTFVVFHSPQIPEIVGPPVPRFLRRRTARTLSADEARGSTGFHRGQMSDKSMLCIGKLP